MSNMTTTDGVNDASTADQWVLVYDAVLGLIVAHHNNINNDTSSKYTMEVFDTETEIVARVAVLGYEMPIELE
jgi:hypothetical protein